MSPEIDPSIRLTAVYIAEEFINSTMEENHIMTITTFNCNGLRDNLKRGKIFSLFQDRGTDVLFLQEVHCQNLEEVKKWEKEYGGKAFWSFGSNFSRGVAILFKQHFPLTYESFYFDRAGRCVTVDIKLGQQRLKFINVYCPNNETERKSFITALDRHLVTNMHFILAGDFNFVEAVEIDKVGGNPIYGTIGRDELDSIKRDFALIDPFRSRNPRLVSTTWSSADNSVHCRLDRFYISKQLNKYVSQTTATPTRLSDHAYVDLVLSIPGAANCGPGYWKCNVSVLDDPDLTADMIQLWKGQGDVLNKNAQWWEERKAACKQLIQLHSIRLAGNRKRNLLRLEKRLRSLDDPVEADIVKLQIERLVSEAAEGARIRSRTQYLDNEEKPSRFFLRKEQSRAGKKLTKLLVNGMETTSIGEVVTECGRFYSDLYNHDPVDESVAEYLLQGCPRLTTENSESCDGMITVDECIIAIKQMDNEKTPGSDGLPKEFYSKFFYLFSHFFVDVCNNLFVGGLLTGSQREGIITLQAKEGQDPLHLGNWRPISLLNVDYKLFPKY